MLVFYMRLHSTILYMADPSKEMLVLQSKEILLNQIWLVFQGRFYCTMYIWLVFQRFYCTVPSWSFKKCWIHCTNYEQEIPLKYTFWSFKRDSTVSSFKGDSIVWQIFQLCASYYTKCERTHSDFGFVQIPWCTFPLTLTTPCQRHTRSCHQLGWLWRWWRLHKGMDPCTVLGSWVWLCPLKPQWLIESVTSWAYLIALPCFELCC